MNILNFYFLLLLIEFFSANDKIYRIKFGLFNQKAKESESSFINNLFYNRIYVNLSIGTPSQILPFELDIKSQTFCISDKYFNKSLSSSYVQVSRENYFYNEDIENGFNSKDILNIDNNGEKINFILATKYPYTSKNILGILGLKIPKFVTYGVYPFFRSLKEAKMINTYTWTVKYFDNMNLLEQIIYNKEKNNIIGEFIFGDEPSNYEKDKTKYNENEFFKINPLTTQETVYWGLEFNNIYIKRQNIKIFYTKEKKAEIVINFSFIMGPQSFFKFIKENYFIQYIAKGICSEKKGNSYETYIECENSPNFIVSSFPDINFDHIGFESTFKLTYKDLFILDEKSNKYIFLILQKDYVTDWSFGTIFLRKYQLFFNEDLKTIGYYRQPDQHYEGNSNNNTNITSNNNEQGNLNEINKASKVKKAFIIILVIIFSFLLFFFGMIFQRKYCNKNRKIRANELEENFSYEANNNNDKKIIEEESENKI